MSGRPVLTAAEIRAAEAVLIEAGTSVDTLMERAGEAVAEAIWRFAGPLPALVLCGPGNNGGDGYVIARVLRERGAAVRVAASEEPATAAARAARNRWGGPVEPLAGAAPAALLVDALFGTGLRRPLEEAIAQQLAVLAAAARVRVAVDLPSGAASDDGRLLSELPGFDLTVALGALKPSHLLQPATALMGRLVLADIGIEARSQLREMPKPRLHPPEPRANKFSRGYVALIAGEMPGAIALAASAAARAGAGYVRLVADEVLAGVPRAVVQQLAADFGDDDRVDAIVVGPGFGRGAEARSRLDTLLRRERPFILDADALMLIENPESLRNLAHVPILTPHEGEFSRLFRERAEADKVGAARGAAARSGAVVVLKGADTVVAAPDGEAHIYASGPAWLATAGTGDVLAGVIATMRAQGLSAFDAACAGVWLHGRAAQLAGPVLIADDLLGAIPAAVAECL